MQSYVEYQFHYHNQGSLAAEGMKYVLFHFSYTGP